MIRVALGHIIPLGERQMQIARLPFRLGGLGLRSISAHAPTAFMAASIETHALMELFRGSQQLSFPDDPLVTTVWPRVPACVQLEVVKCASSFFQHSVLPDASTLASPVAIAAAAGTHDDARALTEASRAAFPAADGKDDDSAPRFKLQRHFSTLLDNHTSRAMDLDDDEQIRANSCGSRGASLYLVGPVSYDDMLSKFFMPSSTFVTALKLRLGGAVHFPTGGMCSVCGNDHHSDEFGNGALTCMRGGARVRAHNDLRDTLAKLMRDSLISPTLEPLVSATLRIRGDIQCFMDGKTWLIDTAITHVFRDSNRSHALQSAGGAATAYEATKVAKYEGHLMPSHVLVPFVPLLPTLSAASCRTMRSGWASRAPSPAALCLAESRTPSSAAWPR